MNEENRIYQFIFDQSINNRPLRPPLVLPPVDLVQRDPEAPVELPPGPEAELVEPLPEALPAEGVDDHAALLVVGHLVNGRMVAHRRADRAKVVCLRAGVLPVVPVKAPGTGQVAEL